MAKQAVDCKNMVVTVKGCVKHKSMTHPHHCLVIQKLHVSQRILTYYTRILLLDLWWPKGWMDQDDTWLAGRPRSRPH